MVGGPTPTPLEKVEELNMGGDAFFHLSPRDDNLISVSDSIILNRLNLFLRAMVTRGKGLVHKYFIICMLLNLIFSLP